MKRTLEEMEADLRDALAAKKKADLHYRAVEKALAEHPAKKTKLDEEARERLRKRLPPYLYRELVTDAANPLDGFYVFVETSEDKSGEFEISLHYTTGRGRRFKIPFVDETLVKDNVDALHMFKTIDFDPDVKAAWKRACDANDNDRACALAALVYAAAMHLGEIDLDSNLLLSLY